MSLKIRSGTDGYASAEDSGTDVPAQTDQRRLVMSAHRTQVAGVQERITAGGERPPITKVKRKMTRSSSSAFGTRKRDSRKKKVVRKVSRRSPKVSSSSSLAASSSSSTTATSSSQAANPLRADAEALIQKKARALSLSRAADSYERRGGKQKINALKLEIQQLERDLEPYKQKSGSKIRIRFSGGKQKRIEEELEQKQAVLSSLRKLQKKADEYLAHRLTISEYDLELGNPVRTEIPNSFAGGDKSDKLQMQRTLIENIERLRETLILQIPEHRIDLSRAVGTVQTFDMEDDYQAFNNYIIHLDMHPGISYDPDTGMLTIPDDGRRGELEVKLIDLPYEKLPDGREIINVGDKSKLMCDQADFSLETFRGRVKMASFNDGCGWGPQSRGAAKKANEVALAIMESDMGSLIHHASKKGLTSRDIIRVHDRALMAAHSVVTATRALGSTCPQLLTVAGDIAHITLVGDTKCFVISSDLSVKDPTVGIRGGQDPTDPGGRIGGFKDSEVGYATFDRDALHGPDLRNYTHCLMKLNPGDTVVMCSDGIGDNIDPEGMGVKPSDDQFPDIDGGAWDDSNPDHVAARNQFQARQMSLILRECQDKKGKKSLTVEEIANALNLHVQDNALRYKALAGAGLGKSSAANGVPGKPDHAGMLIYRHPIEH